MYQYHDDPKQDGRRPGDLGRGSRESQLLLGIPALGAGHPWQNDFSSSSSSSEEEEPEGPERVVNRLCACESRYCRKPSLQIMHHLMEPFASSELLLVSS